MTTPSAADQQLANRINTLLADDGSLVRWTGEGWVWSGACGDIAVTLDEVVAFILGTNPSALGAEARS